MVEKTSQQAGSRSEVTPGQAEALAQRLADKPYGKEKKTASPDTESLSRTTISLPTTLLRQMEDLAYVNKREGKHLRNVSAIVREALTNYLIKNSE